MPDYIVRNNTQLMILLQHMLSIILATWTLLSAVNCLAVPSELSQMWFVL